METSIDILKRKITNFSPDLIEAFAKIVDRLEETTTSQIPDFQREEILYRIQFHNENPKTKLDFFENIEALEKICA